jgi:IS66 Orf2 like protein
VRCGFDRLAERVRVVIGQDPLGGHLFVFRSRRRERVSCERNGDHPRMEVAAKPEAAIEKGVAGAWAVGLPRDQQVR